MTMVEAPIAEVELHTESAADTQELGARLGALLRGGEVIALLGELGAGKTTFVQGMLRGMGSRDRVTSPTFTLVNLYRAGGLEVHHVDVYRLGAAATGTVAGTNIATETADDHALDAIGLGLDDILHAPDVVVIMEWAEIVPTLWRAADLSIRLTAEDDHRAIHFAASNGRGAELLAHLPPIR